MLARILGFGLIINNFVLWCIRFKSASIINCCDVFLLCATFPSYLSYPPLDSLRCLFSIAMMFFFIHLDVELRKSRVFYLCVGACAEYVCYALGGVLLWQQTFINLMKAGALRLDTYSNYINNFINTSHTSHLV